MEEKKLYELKTELKEVFGVQNTQSCCVLEIQELKEVLNLKTSVTLTGLEIDSSSTVTIFLLSNEKTLGVTKVSLSTLFSEMLTGKVDRWFKLKSEDFPDLKLRLFMSLSKVEKPKSRQSHSSRRSSKAIKEPKCPFLEKIELGKDTRDEPLNEIWKNRDTLSHLIKISLEPDSPTRLESEKYDFSDIESLTIEKLQELSGFQLKQIVRLLCEEAKSLSVISKNLPNISSSLQEKIKERRELEKKSQEELDFIKENWTLKHEEVKNLEDKRKLAFGVLIEKKEDLASLKKELDGVKSEFEGLKRENLTLVTKKVSSEDNEKANFELKQLILLANRKKEELREKKNKAEVEFAEAQQTAMKNIENFKKEAEETKQKIETVNKEYKTTAAANESLKLKINSLKSQLSRVSDLKASSEASISAYKSELSLRDEKNACLQLLFEEVLSENSKNLLEKQQLLSEKKNLFEQLSNMEADIENTKKKQISLNQQTFEASSEKIAQEEICCIRADLTQLLEDLKRLEKFQSDTKTVFVKDLKAGSDILISDSEKVYLRACQLDLMIDTVDKKEEELDGLKDRMGEVQKRNPPYVPAKDDLVDAFLAEFLNARDNSNPIKFIRQDGGNYLFGTKKVYLKIENGKLLVKVGGGFTSIEEFLTIYTPLELEKADASPGSPKIITVRQTRESSPNSAIRGQNESAKSPKKY